MEWHAKSAILYLMFAKIARAFRTMELEEKILHSGILLTAIGVFLPWFGGLWFGSESVWSGFGFYTSYIGGSVFLIQVFLLVMTLSPLAGGPIIIRKSSRNYVRLLLCGISVILLLAALTVLLRVTFEVTRAEIRFGMYVSLVGSIVACLYSFLRHQEQQRNEVQELFRHPEVQSPAKQIAKKHEEEEPLPPPPPPPPPPPEDHNLFSQP